MESFEGDQSPSHLGHQFDPIKHTYQTKQLMRVIVNMNGKRANPDNATPTYSTEEEDEETLSNDQNN